MNTFLKKMLCALGYAALPLFACFVLEAQNAVQIDARSQPATPAAVPAQLGSSLNPRGDALGVNSQYLTRNGIPWIPVMGEFHFSRYPREQWEPELLKMKAAGVDIISTYIIWIHHEQTEGHFDWSGQRDLRAFVELCAKHGLYVYPRIGPWAHAETRNGGFPDWVLKNSPVRQNDPTYLREVDRFYAQIATQLHGLLWKDGGPVIGIQIENEYRGKGAGKGEEHIRTLKKIALEHGLDVPLYTVTGWDGAAIPLDAALPVFGGYPDAPWDGSPKPLPPNEIYAFRFANRSAGSMGAIGGHGQSAASTYQGTPFLTAEVGGGIEDTYFRRPVVTADDIAAEAPVMLGSGVNLLGFYMFHGGRNPEGGDITLQESQRTGYPTDVPVKSYDFQAPIGEFGQERPSLRKLKLIDYFLEDFGADLAPMKVHAPAKLPANPSDVSVPRVSARTLGKAGFVFFNNHVRGAAPHDFGGFQVQLQLPEEELHIPAHPITLPAGAYGIWPVNFRLGTATLCYSTAQLFKHVQSGPRTYYFFFSVPGIAPELMLDRNAKLLSVTEGVEQMRSQAGLLLRPDASRTTVAQLAGSVSLVVMPEAEAENLWRGDDPSVLVSADADVYSDGPRWTLQQNGNTHFSFAVFGGRAPQGATAAVERGDKLFRGYSASVPKIDLQATVHAAWAAEPPLPPEMGPSVSWRPRRIPLAPDDASFARAAGWDVHLPAIPASPHLADVLLDVHYEGDVARLYQGGRLVEDNFWNGEPWQVGLKGIGQFAQHPTTLQMDILPLAAGFPMYLEKASILHFSNGKALSLQSVELVPRYQYTFEFARSR